MRLKSPGSNEYSMSIKVLKFNPFAEYFCDYISIFDYNVGKVLPLYWHVCIDVWNTPTYKYWMKVNKTFIFDSELFCIR